MGVWVIEAHIVAMYLPGLLTADVIKVSHLGTAVILHPARCSAAWQWQLVGAS
jgi:hypothetical protein